MACNKPFLYFKGFTFITDSLSWLPFFLFLPPLQANSTPSSPLSLSEAVHYALQHSPTVDTAQKNEAIQTLEYEKAIAQLLPSLSISATHGLQNLVPISSNPHFSQSNPDAPWYSSLNLEANEILYNNGETLTHIQVAKLKQELALVNSLKARAQLTLQVTEGFYRYSLATALLEVKKKQQNILEKQFKTLSQQYQQGLKVKTDFLRLKTQVQRSEIDQIIAHNQMNLSISELRRLLGTNPQERALPDFEAIVVKNEVNIEQTLSLKSLPLEKSYDYRLSKIQEEIDIQQLKITHKKSLPQISITSGINYSKSNYLNSNKPFNATQQLSWNILLNIKYDLWDWGTRRKDLQIAENQYKIQENNHYQNLLEINTQISNLMNDLSRLKHQFKLNQELLSLEEKNAKMLENQYREGKFSYLDFINSINNLLDARVQFYTSYFDTYQGISRYHYFEGTIHENFFKK